MSASYSCSKCGATSGSGGTCCGRPMSAVSAVNSRATSTGVAVKGREARIQARRGKR